MAITHLRINQFRNLNNVQIEPKSGLNFIFGPNGSGKTSLLEAVYCLGRAKSFRTHKVNQLIARGLPHFILSAKIAQGTKVHTVGMQKSPESMTIRLSGNTVSKATELTEVLPIALLEPGLHRLIEEGPEYRRKFLDWGVFHVEQSFSVCWSNFKRLLQQRNAALKSGWTYSQIRHWDQELITMAEQIDALRRQYLRQLKPYIQQISQYFHQHLDTEIMYYSGWREGESFADCLQRNFESDQQRGFTQAGPQRADIRIKVGGVEAQAVLSRGQQKILVASLILAQCLQLSQHETSTVILMDDLPAELDTERRQGLLAALQASGSQVFITATEETLFEQDVISRSKVFHVEQGQVHG